MTTTARTTEAKQVPMDPSRKTALVAGVFYLMTMVSIPILALYNSARTDPNFIISSGTDTAVLVGGVLEVIVALAGIGTAITLFPVVRRQNEGMALGFVAARVLEAGMIYTGVVSLHSLVTLRQPGATGADAASLVTTGESLVATYNWAFLLGQSLTPGLNALLLGTLMYRSGLVPRVLPMLGLIGAPFLIAGVFATLLGLTEQTNPLVLLPAFPIFVWELSLGIYLIVKGFKPCPITAAMHAADTPRVYRDVVA
jgi:hypothetical protein